jgi:hypothetical protein
VEDQLSLELVGKEIEKDEPFISFNLILFTIIAVMILVAISVIAVKRRSKKK